jgi:hypothetical protein
MCCLAVTKNNSSQKRLWKIDRDVSCGPTYIVHDHAVHQCPGFDEGPVEEVAVVGDVDPWLDLTHVIEPVPQERTLQNRKETQEQGLHTGREQRVFYERSPGHVDPSIRISVHLYL